MIRFNDVPEGLMVVLTDKARLLKEFPDLDVELRELMELSDFTPEGSKKEEWDDISFTIGTPAIGFRIYDEGDCLAHSEDFDYRMFEYMGVDKKNYLNELVEKGHILFTPFNFTRVPPGGLKAADRI